jgi:hypothetical protein
MVNNHSVVIHKAGYKKGRRHDNIFDIYEKPICHSSSCYCDWSEIPWNINRFPRTDFIALPYKKRRNSEFTRGKRVTKFISKIK